MINIYIERRTYTQQSIVSTLLVASTRTSMHFAGYALENSHAGSHHDKLPTPPGTYAAKVRTDGRLGWRLELLQVPGHTHIEIHIGNFARNSHGCFLPGLTRQPNAVSQSGAALRDIEAIVKTDGSGIIKVHIVGSDQQR